MFQAFQNHPARLRVEGKELTILDSLGNGAFGVVYKVQDMSSSRVYALKDVLCLNQAAIQNAFREVETMKQISHENVIAIIGADQYHVSQGLHMLILTEYCGGGNLNDRLNRPSTEETNLKWFRQTTAALAYLHSHEVVHRDLKPENVLLTETDDIKLADFGLAREYIALQQTGLQLDDDSWMTAYTQYYMNTFAGTPYWMAPEVFTGHYTEKADVFSLGVIFFAILERDFIMKNGKVFYGAFTNTNIPSVGTVALGYAMANYDPNITIAFSSQAQGRCLLMQQLALNALSYNPHDRMGAEDIFKRL